MISNRHQQDQQQPHDDDEDHQQQQQQRNTNQFPWKLHQVLSDAENNGEDAVISWLPDGKAFCIHNRERFLATIMKTYFSQTKFKSFQRQMNLWGFQKVPKAERRQKDSYFHRYFVKGQPDLCRKMIRQRIKGSKLPHLLLQQHQQQQRQQAASILAKSSSAGPKPSSPASSAITTDQSATLRFLKSLVNEPARRMSEVSTQSLAATSLGGYGGATTMLSSLGALGAIGSSVGVASAPGLLGVGDDIASILVAEKIARADALRIETLTRATQADALRASVERELLVQAVLAGSSTLHRL